MGGPVFYKNHMSECDTIEDAIQSIYESLVIRKALILCISNEDATMLQESLLQHQYPAQLLLESTFELENPNHSVVMKTLRDFKELPNQILIISLSAFHTLSEELFYDYIANAFPNLLINNDLPTYHMDKVLLKMHQSHQQGFWDNAIDTFHVLWYMS
jgi:hypothetical protein